MNHINSCYCYFDIAKLYKNNGIESVSFLTYKSPTTDLAA